MRIVVSEPPNIERLKKVFDFEGKKPIFTFGDTIYNPHGTPLADHIIIHEEVHQKQQKDPNEWWEKYLTDKEFRLSQEVEAYREQYKYAVKYIKDKNTLAKFLHALSADLSSPMYGNIISYQEAKNKIK